MGKRDNEQGPKLVKRPPRKTIRSDIGLGSLSPLFINSSPFLAKSDKVKLIEEKVKKLSSSLSSIPDYPLMSLVEGFLLNKSVDSIEDLTNNAAISKLEINEFPP